MASVVITATAQITWLEIDQPQRENNCWDRKSRGNNENLKHLNIVEDLTPLKITAGGF